MLKWTYELVTLNASNLSMELSNLLDSIRKKLIKLGMGLLGRVSQD